MKAETLDEAVAKYLRNFREEHSLTLDQVANAAKKYGAQWGPASVRSIEQAESSLTLEKLIFLALSIRILTPSQNTEGTPVSLKQLFGDTECFRLGDDDERSPTAMRSWIDAALSGEPLDPLKRTFKSPVGYKKAQFIEKHPEEHGFPSGISAEQIFDAVPTGAETRAAKRLGLSSPLKLSVWAQHLWGQSLDEEAASRAGADSTPQARGRVTRILVEEIQAAIKERKNDG